MKTAVESSYHNVCPILYLSLLAIWYYVCIHACHSPELLWQAPELLRGELLGGGDSQKADIYSLGIVLYEVITRSSPYEDVREKLTVQGWTLTLDKLRGDCM